MFWGQKEKNFNLKVSDKYNSKKSIQMDPTRVCRLHCVSPNRVLWLWELNECAFPF